MRILRQQGFAVQTFTAEHEVTPAGLLQLLADKGFDPVYGARPVKRAIQRALETPIARKIVGGAYPPGATVRVTAAGGELALS